MTTRENTKGSKKEITKPEEPITIPSKEAPNTIPLEKPSVLPPEKPITPPIEPPTIFPVDPAISQAQRLVKFNYLWQIEYSLTPKKTIEHIPKSAQTVQIEFA
jgi:hypothetical protein